MFLREFGLHLQIFLITPLNSKHNLGGRIYSVKKSNKHGLSNTITKEREVQISIRFFVLFHHTFAYGTQISRPQAD